MLVRLAFAWAVALPAASPASVIERPYHHNNWDHPTTEVPPHVAETYPTHIIHHEKIMRRATELDARRKAEADAARPAASDWAAFLAEVGQMQPGRFLLPLTEDVTRPVGLAGGGCRSPKTTLHSVSLRFLYEPCVPTKYSSVLLRIPIENRPDTALVSRLAPPWVIAGIAAGDRPCRSRMNGSVALV